MKLEMSLYPFQEIQTLEELASSLRNNYKCCWFLGAGVSKIAGYPLWRELVIDMIDYFEKNKDKIKDLKSQYEFHELIVKRKGELIHTRKMRKEEKLIIEREFKGDPVEVLTILKKCNSQLFNKGIQEIFNECKKNEDSRIYEMIGKFIERDINSVIITTNIDKGLQNYLNLSDERVTILGANSVKRSVEPKIIYLHGRIDYPDSWVFTEYEYAEAYNLKEHVKEFLKRFLKNIEVLIVLGYSLQEKDIYRVFWDEEIKSKINIYWIEGADEEKEKDLIKHLTILRGDNSRGNELKIKLVTFRIINNNYQNLFDVLNELYNKAYGITWEEGYE